MKDKGIDIRYDELMEIINTIKTYSGRNEVMLISNNKSFEELKALNFPLSNFKCQVLDDELEESKLFIVPIEL